jgi:hypothetical protein
MDHSISISRHHTEPRSDGGIDHPDFAELARDLGVLDRCATEALRQYVSREIQQRLERTAGLTISRLPTE